MDQEQQQQQPQENQPTEEKQTEEVDQQETEEEGVQIINGVRVEPPKFIEDVLTSTTVVTDKNEAAPESSTFVEGTNKLTKNVHCRLCDCKIIAPDNAVLVDKKITLVQKKSSNAADELKWMWFLADMFHFENVAFTKDVNATHKYLTCADCEAEIIGIHYIDSKENYVAHDRVVYK
ncbi:hypothetical protein CYY_000730 [Polysphondylium violaceum]|uniref:Mss4-like family protein n=1 Tax=Polysphondylium violaceum TaxID=133409 RepID=A0A8J4Q314_9MYCE|nr:hypothetical protein CYY_000730 [Polysphondylium violaceum]